MANRCGTREHDPSLIHCSERNRKESSFNTHDRLGCQHARHLDVSQVVRDLKGNLLADKMVGHIFRVEQGLVRRFDIREASNSGASSSSGRTSGPRA